MIRWIFLSTCLFLGACKKKDEHPPSVKINAPNNLTQFNYQDAIIVDAFIEDESKLEHVDLELLDDALNLLQSTRFKPVGKTYHMGAGFDLDDIHYETGQYYIRVTGFDGVNETSEYLEFSYQGVSKQLEDVLYVENMGGQFSVKSMNDGSNIYSIGGDFLDIRINSYDQIIYSGGKELADLSAYDLTNLSVKWSRPSMASGGNDWFLGMDYFTDDRELYYGDGDGRKFLVSRSGQSNTVVNGINSYLPEEAALIGDFLMVDEKNVSTSVHSLFSYNKNSGVLNQSTVLAFDAKAIYPKSNNEAYVFGYDGTQIRMAIYNISSNSFWEPYSFGTADLNEVIQLDGDRFVLLTSLGVDLYTYSSNGSVPISTQIFQKGKYCTTCNSLYMLNSSEIVEMSLLGSVIQTSSISNGVDLDLQYNK